VSRTRRRLGAAVSSRQARRRGGLALLVGLAVLGGATSALLAGSRPATAANLATSTGPSCPTSNAPDELTLGGGTPQSAKLDSPFAAPFQVVLAASNGCPVTTAVAGTAVTFSAPANGSSTASGTFAATGSSSATVGTDANGSAQAPAFTANDIPGSYTVTASSSYGSVTFNLTNTAAGVAATITAEAPLSEAAFTGATYNKPLQVRVLDANGNPVEGVTVNFTLGSGSGGAGSGAQAAGASFAGGQSQASAQTNASGLATSPPLTADSTPGRFTATAATAGVTVPASFQLDNVAGKAPTLTLLGASHRSALIGTGYGEPLQVEVLDAAGKPVQGASVTFTLGSSAGGGGAGSASAEASFVGGSSEATETTGARGRASSPLFTANDTAGSFTATVSVSGRANPLAVSLDNLAGKPPVIRPVGAARGSATVNRRYRRPLEVRLLDARGKPVQGTTVTFSLGAGGSGGGSGAGASASAGASFLDGSSQATETTNAGGIAVSPGFTADGTAGVFAATASVSGVTNPAMFALDNLAARPPAIRPSGAEPRSATVGGRYPTPLRVTVVAADGKPEQGTTVTFTLGAAGAGGGTGAAGSAGASFVGGSSEATETTNAAGQAVSPAFAADTVAGAFTATASISGTSRVASFPLRNLAGEPTTVTAGAAASEETGVGTRFPIALAVTVKDSDGNPVAGAVVTFTAPASRASGRFATHPHARARRVQVKTNSDGIAVAPAFVANKEAGGYVVAATVKGATAAFALVNQPPAS
jgi:adhesin/invasin